ncbi:MAG TPA: DUF6265 family protein [Chitinophaga sp.]|uniref:DUF6265 family protein n=1 Tax=Chitinophaga sp. TaxID=1869181 RepID=UPI002BE45EEA|nr:DUF6265 family protein [Chitinophaga sp.]HVI43916.1 DUF6265 family protein [Chitinophaga sp.]
MMKPFLTLASALLLAATLSYGQQATEKLRQLQWLEGSWKRVNAKPGRAGYEHWKKVSPEEWKGYGITMKGRDTLFTEGLQLLVKDSELYYVATVAENKGPVYFRLTAVSENGFTCENPEHDFPQRITYNREGAQLKVVTSARDKAITFLFEKE